jgi:hypothetical protein
MFTSESSREMWESRWETMWEQGRESELGPAGQAYIADKYGEKYYPEDPPYDEYDDYGEYDFDIEY